MNRLRPLAPVALLLALVCALVARATRTPAPLPADAPATAFSAMRALEHERVIAAGPHPTGGAGAMTVREYITGRLQALGLQPQLQEATAVGTRYPVAGHVVNILARVPGRVPGGKAVLVAVHHDGVWASPAAGDDGAGVAALLETLRALRAGPPLEHDVIALFTDGEEAGLLGAAAFVREHPWAKDAEVVLDFEARGTEGRSLMFETGAGNLDVARVLRTVGDVSGSSLSVTVYRSLPNDTDLSELHQLGKPALNFAFVDGVERYHTGHDGVGFLDPGSLQHHGEQMLALVRAFGDGPLPRPVTGDAIFFDLPFVGLVVLPEGARMPFAIVVLVLLNLLIVRRARTETRWGLGLALGVVGLAVSVTVAAFLVTKLSGSIESLHASRGWDGWPSWRPVYAAAYASFALTVAMASWALMRRWASEHALHAGALVAWTLLAVVLALRLPGAMYLLAVPACAVLAAVLSTGRISGLVLWLATALALAILVPVTYTTGGYTLPLSGPGGTATAVLVTMTAWLLLPHLEAIAGEQRWRATGVVGAVALATIVAGVATVRRSERYAATVNLTYVTSAERDSAWLVAPATLTRPGDWAAEALGERRQIARAATADSAMRWIFDARGVPQAAALRSVPRVTTGAPEATVVADSVSGERRRLTVRFRAPAGALTLLVNGAEDARAISVDGRMLDTTRYRRVPRALALPFTSPPDSGFVAVLDVPRDAVVELHLTAGAPGLPAIPGVTIPPRPADVVPVQNGDVTVWYRKVRLSPAAASPAPRGAASGTAR